MKKIVLFLVLTFISCEREGLYTKRSNLDIDFSNANLVYQSTFIPTSGISVQGEAQVYQVGNELYLNLNNFSISEGPDLKVYLSKDNYPTEFINLGALESSTVKLLPNGVDLNDYNFVLIHCQAFNHLFAYAQLN